MHPKKGFQHCHFHISRFIDEHDRLLLEKCENMTNKEIINRMIYRPSPVMTEHFQEQEATSPQNEPNYIGSIINCIFFIIKSIIYSFIGLYVLFFTLFVYTVSKELHIVK